MKKMFFIPSPIGELGIAESEGKIAAIFLKDRQPKIAASLNDYIIEQTPLIKEAQKQLDEYFAGRRKIFDLPLLHSGTEFQQRVYKALAEIEYGNTKTYSQLAQQLSAPKACRAVGQASGKNPHLIVVPCHRCVGKNGLTGFAAGVENKQILLKVECQNK